MHSRNQEKIQRVVIALLLVKLHALDGKSCTKIMYEIKDQVSARVALVLSHANIGDRLLLTLRMHNALETRYFSMI